MNRSSCRCIHIVRTLVAMCALLLLPLRTLAAPISTTDTTVDSASAPSGAKSADQCDTGQFFAEYFAGMALTDSPVFSQCEVDINHDSDIAPWPGNGVRSTQFAARWTGRETFAGGTYVFTATGDDGIRVFLDNVPLIDHWVDQASTTYTVTQPISAGTHIVRVEYYQNCCVAVAHVSWKALAAPTVAITMPTLPLTAKIGDVITYAGTALDPQDGSLPVSGLAWQIIFHDCHGASCVLRPYWHSNGPTGSFTIPDAGDAGYFEFTLTATNHGGLKASASVTVQLQSAQFTLSTVPSGLQVVYGGTTYTTPITLTTVAGAVRTIYAPSPQNDRAFVSWSDGGLAQHNITVGAAPGSYTATFAASGASSAASLLWTTTGAANPLGRPAFVASDGASNVYVVDSLHHRIQKFDANGSPVLIWGTEGSGDGQFFFREQPDHAAGVTVDKAGNVYVADFNNHRIQKFDASGTFLGKWGTQGTGDGQFNFPTGIVTDAQGNVYVADSGNDRIQKFDRTGMFLGKWGRHGTGMGQFWGPNGVTIDSKGNVLVADSTNNRIQQFDANGTFIAAWGSGGAGNGQFNLPFGIAVDSQGRVYVTDNRNGRIQRFDSNGNFLDTLDVGSKVTLAFPAGIAVDSQNNVYVSERNDGRLDKFQLSQAPPLLPQARR